MKEKNVLITVPVSLELRENFKRFAATNGTDMSQLLRNYMEASVGDETVLRGLEPPGRGKSKK